MGSGEESVSMQVVTGEDLSSGKVGADSCWDTQTLNSED